MHINMVYCSQNTKILNKIVFLIRWSIDTPFPKHQLIHRSFILKKKKVSHSYLKSLAKLLSFLISVFLFTVKMWAIVMLRKNNRLQNTMFSKFVLNLPCPHSLHINCKDKKENVNSGYLLDWQQQGIEVGVGSQFNIFL